MVLTLDCGPLVNTMNEVVAYKLYTAFHQVSEHNVVVTLDCGEHKVHGPERVNHHDVT